MAGLLTREEFILRFILATVQSDTSLPFTDEYVINRASELYRKTYNHDPRHLVPGWEKEYKDL